MLTSVMLSASYWSGN